jgi:4-alpha-methyl-delta7-sterol-4alpha-methyl oxidase
VLASTLADPTWQALVLEGSLVSAIAFFAFAAPLTWIAYREPGWARAWRVQDRRPDFARWLAPAVGWWLANSALVFASLTLTWSWWGPWSTVRVDPPGVDTFSWFEAAWQLPFFVYLDDALYFWMHRAMHRGPLYRHVHAMHHRVVTPFALTGHDMHPVEYAATAALMLVGPMLVGAHVQVVYAWIALRQLEAAEGHGGLQLPFSPLRLFPGNHGAAFHDFHHSRFHGNYSGFLGWIDARWGTLSRGYATWREARQARAGLRG